MKELMLKEKLSIELIIGIIINVFIVNTAQLVLISFSYALLADRFTPLGYNIWYVCLFLTILTLILKFILFPLYCSLVNKYSKKASIVSFLSNIKTNVKEQAKILLYSFLVDMINSILWILYVYHFGSVSAFLSNFKFWFVIYVITGAGLFGSYLALFAGWKIKSNVINSKKPQI